MLNYQGMEVLERIIRIRRCGLVGVDVNFLEEEGARSNHSFSVCVYSTGCSSQLLLKHHGSSHDTNGLSL